MGLPVGWILLSSACLTITALWLIFKNWVISNMLAFCMSVFAVSIIRIPNLKVSALCLALLLIYDVFWVFYSKYFFFKANVMATAATTVNVPNKLQLPKTTTLPNGKQVTQYSILGLGDIVLPSLLLSYAARFDMNKKSTLWNGYFLCGLCGYCVGLVICQVTVIKYHIGQPALLYLVPSTILPIIYLGYKRSELKELWFGFKEHTEDNEKPSTDIEQQSKQV